jgi:multiple sugar transport system substrate-binding protein
MLDLQFSLIGEPTPDLSRMLDSFQAEHNMQLKLNILEWERAWPELVAYGLYGRGPDVSQVGSTWASSLVGMNCLRPFTPWEMSTLGGAEAFLPQSWQSGLMPGQSQLWAAPWNAYTFVLCYRRDLIRNAGIEEASAFNSAEDLTRTLARLKSSGVEMPWVVPYGPTHPDTVHYVSSWVWGAGGDYVAADEKHMSFTQPATLAGMMSYFDLFHYLSPDIPHLSQEQTLELFVSGKAAVTIAGADIPYGWLRGNIVPEEVRENLGIAVIPGVPWIGGDNLVIWQHTQLSPERERVAVALVNFLTSRRTQQINAQAEIVNLPTRLDSQQSLPLQGTMITQMIIQSLRVGRAYAPMSMWGRIEHQLGLALGQAAEEVVAGMESEIALRKYLVPLERRLELAFRVPETE